MKKLSVCILFGGMSPEHAVSLRSAESVLNNIDKTKYTVLPVGITPEGTWILFGGSDYVILFQAGINFQLTPKIFSHQLMGEELGRLNRDL